MLGFVYRKMKYIILYIYIFLFFFHFVKFILEICGILDKGLGW